MSVTLDPPSQLFFERPLTRSTSETLTLTNQESEEIAFKVKTTSPKQYCVRPNSGRIEPGQKVEVQIWLQPFKEEPPTDFKCKDKFLVLTAIIPPEKIDLPTSQLWSVLEHENKPLIKERKLRCLFLPPSDTNYESENQTPNSDANLTKIPPSYSSGSLASTASPNFNTAREVPVIKRQPEELKSLLPDDLPRVNGSINSTGTPVKEVETLKSDLSQAKASIQRLETELELYRNKLKAAESSSSATTKQASSHDLNVQLLGGVALASFLIGCWLF